MKAGVGVRSVWGGASTKCTHGDVGPHGGLGRHLILVQPQKPGLAAGVDPWLQQQGVEAGGGGVWAGSREGRTQESGDCECE